MIPFKIRCSAIGQIMTNSRKKGELSKTTQSYLDLWIKEKISLDAFTDPALGVPYETSTDLDNNGSGS